MTIYSSIGLAYNFKSDFYRGLIFLCTGCEGIGRCKVFKYYKSVLHEKCKICDEMDELCRCFK